MNRKPLTQGDEDGFCGLYAITNVLTLLFPLEMDETLRADVFKTLARNTVSLWPDVLWDGTHVGDIRSMLNAGRSILRKRGCGFDWEEPFKHRKFAEFAEFTRELKWRIEGDGACAIVGLCKPWEHWTATHRLTARQMVMTDSCHVKRIPFARCGFHGAGAVYEFDHRQTFVLRRPAQ
jgi:hypothetical protein